MGMPENLKEEEGMGDDLSMHVEHYPHTEGSNQAIYQFQIDNNNKDDKQSGAVQFTAEVSPDMDVTNAYFFREKTGQAATKEDCKVGQRSPAAQDKINKKFREQRSPSQSLFAVISNTSTNSPHSTF